MGIGSHVIVRAILFGSCLLVCTQTHAGLIPIAQARSVDAAGPFAPFFASQSSKDFEFFYGAVSAAGAEALQTSHIGPDLVVGELTAIAGQPLTSASSSMSLTFDVPDPESYTLGVSGTSSAGVGSSFSLVSGEEMLLQFSARHLDQEYLSTKVTLPAGRYTLTATAEANSPQSSEVATLQFTLRLVSVPEPSTFLLAALAGLGPEARNRDVIEKLAGEKVTVSAQMVSTVRKRMGGAPSSNGHRRPGRPSKKSAAGSVTLRALLAAKELVAQSGSVESAKAALDVLGRLQ